eukprot:2154417-Rhodomonas_salina.1
MVDNEGEQGDSNVSIETQSKDVSEAAPNEDEIEMVRTRARARQMEDSQLDPIPEEVDAINDGDNPPAPAINAIVNEPGPVRVEGGG